MLIFIQSQSQYSYLVHHIIIILYYIADYTSGSTYTVSYSIIQISQSISSVSHGSISANIYVVYAYVLSIELSFILKPEQQLMLYQALQEDSHICSLIYSGYRALSGVTAVTGVDRFEESYVYGLCYFSLVDILLLC